MDRLPEVPFLIWVVGLIFLAALVDGLLLWLKAKFEKPKKKR